MPRFKQLIPLIVLEFEGNTWPYYPHNHDHFEIIHIRKGKGKHIINDVVFPYCENDLFLISPNDTHSFKVEEYTSFCYLKFTNSLFSESGKIVEKENQLRQLQTVIKHPHLQAGNVKYHQKDLNMIIELIEIVVYENSNRKRYSDVIISDGIGVILNLMARNLSSGIEDPQTLSISNWDDFSDVFNFIRLNIKYPQLLTIFSLSDRFNKSPNYFGHYFKRKAGISLKQYINNYRVIQSEILLKNTQYSHSEIAFQLGYCNVSHLNREFKNKYGVSPGLYRKKYKLSNR